MKNLFKRSLCLVISLIIAVGSISALAYTNESALNKAKALQTLELFKGTDKGFELEKPLTRLESLILMIRLTGQESDALYGDELTSPFTDVPTWEGASNYIAYGYKNNLAKGVSDTLFAPNERATAQVYLTFVLRALGYDDAWNNWEKLGKEAGILTNDVDTNNFLRGDAVTVSYAALNSKIKGTDKTLSEDLLEKNVFGEFAYKVSEAAAGKEIGLNNSLIDILSKLYASATDEIFVSRLMVSDITKDNMKNILGVDNIPLKEGIVCEPMMIAQAHSVSLLRVEEGSDIAKIKKDIRENIDPRKWICVAVEPENVFVENIGNLILVVMDNSAPDKLVKTFRSMDTSLVKPDSNNMLNIDNFYAEAFDETNRESVLKFAEKLQTLKEKYFKDNKNVYYATIPDKTYFMKDKTMNYLNHDIIKNMLKGELFRWNEIDISNLLELSDYYVTDPHWRQEKLVDVVAEIGKKMNFTIDEKSFTEKTKEDFVGTYNKKVKDIKPEKLVWLTNPAIENATVDNFQDKTFKKVYDEKRLDTEIEYDLFLSGATPLTVIENKDAKEKRELVIFRDSYGSSIAPLFIDAYSKITLVDLRYMISNVLPKYVDLSKADILFLYSDELVNNSSILK